VLGEAQAKGYAEADPTFDIEGIDAAHKLSILSAIAFGAQIDFASVDTQGISRSWPPTSRRPPRWAIASA
jgi:homoserine dehydrogenase